MSESLSPMDYLNLLDQVSAEFQAQADAINAAVAAAAATVETKYFTIRVTNTQVESLEFTDQAGKLAGTQLREMVLKAYADACAEASTQLADSVSRAGSPAVAEGVRQARRPETAEAVERRDAAVDRGSAEEADAPADADQPTAREQLAAQVGKPLLPLSREEIDELAAQAPEDPAADLQADPDWIKHHRPEPASGWQADWAQELTDHVATVKAQLQEAANRHTTASSTKMTVVVSTDGSLLDLTFRRRAEASVLTSEFTKLYAEAVTEAATEAAQLLDDLDDDDEDDDDPTEDFFADLLSRFQPPEPDETRRAPRRW
ncbi:hypothetical protein [Parenemella sanctibonifatiensis]|uniref:YbaB/EbfC family DNA-binding protein n=1 Tax=Parenemella sanctibonifatiensis TaxID=2016505 RepID=A0A255DZI4_9ACTN|nr:hypothetical protein [Parenemella sanctibonifatiensis]OYN84727.1 hypothetical protein CGZ92_12980 [Parenemella sanctibonifatiensis]